MAERFAAMPIPCHCRVGQFARSIPGNRKGERKKPRSSIVAGRLHRGVHVGDEFIGGMGDVSEEKTGREGLPGCGKWDKIPLTTRAVALRTKHRIKPKKIGRNEL